MRTYEENVMFNLLGYAQEITSIPPEAFCGNDNSRDLYSIRVIITNIAFREYAINKRIIAKSLNVSTRRVLEYAERSPAVLAQDKGLLFIRRMIHQLAEDHLSANGDTYSWV